MNSGSKIETRPLAAAARHSIVTLVVIVIDVLVVAIAAASRVGRIDPAVARFRITPIDLLVPLAAAALGIAWIVIVFRLAERRFRRTTGIVIPSNEAGGIPIPARDDVTSVATLALVPLAVLAVNLAPFHLALPLAGDGGPLRVPILGTEAGRYVLPVNVLLGLELALAAARLCRFRPKPWWQARFITYLLWLALLIVMIAGPNLLKGDPLEWSAAFPASPSSLIPQRWLQEAPRAIEAWWPGIQVLLVIGVVSVVVRLVRTVPMLVKSLRKG